MDRRDFLAPTAAVAAAPLASGAGNSGSQAKFTLEEITLEEIAAALADGRLSSWRLNEMYIARIHALDRRGPMLRAVLEINPRALDIAGDLDRERAATGLRGPLHGVP